MLADWPVADGARIDATIEARFAHFQNAVGAVREIRSRQNIPAKQRIRFSIAAAEPVCDLLRPMGSYFETVASTNATLVAAGQNVSPPAPCAQVKLQEMEVFVDLAGLIDVSAEIARNEQQEKKLLGLIAGKEKKLSNEDFVAKAPADVVERERDSLAQLKQQLVTVRDALVELRQQA
jgi:valyl-tRNA synthetase